jgi:hypothetical protein
MPRTIRQRGGREAGKRKTHERPAQPGWAGARWPQRFGPLRRKQCRQQDHTDRNVADTMLVAMHGNVRHACFRLAHVLEDLSCTRIRHLQTDDCRHHLRPFRTE